MNKVITCDIRSEARLDRSINWSNVCDFPIRFKIDRNHSTIHLIGFDQPSGYYYPICGICVGVCVWMSSMRWLWLQIAFIGIDIGRLYLQHDSSNIDFFFSSFQWFKNILQSRYLDKLNRCKKVHGMCHQIDCVWANNTRKLRQ